MPKGDKSAYTDKPKRQAGAIENGHEPKSGARPKADARAWATASKLHGQGNKFGTGRKVPNGPVGGSGRKTNLARSS